MTFNLVNKYLLVSTWALFCGQNSRSGDMNEMSERVILHGALTAKSLIFQPVATHSMKQKREPWCSKKQLSKSDIARKNAPIDCLLAAHSLPRVQQVSEWEKRQDRNPNNHRKNQGTIYTAAPVTHTHVSVTLKTPRRTSRA
jgi:hypothetical protein